MEHWKQSNIQLDVDLLLRENYNYVKINFLPNGRLNLTNSTWATPKGKTKSLITESLLNIYYSWHNTFKTLNQPYYLKIWFYDPNFLASQEVGQVGEKINHYKNKY